VEKHGNWPFKNESSVSGTGMGCRAMPGGSRRGGGQCGAASGLEIPGVGTR